jgi:foldase protein PrsA
MRKALLLILACGVLFGCGSKDESASKETEATSARVEADYIRVQHILIGFLGSIPGKSIERSREESQVLAQDVLKRAKAGEDYDALVQEYTDDSAPGYYWMANTGVSQKPGVQTFPRERMVKGFGDAGFALEVGEFGMAEYHAADSPYGWHIVKRVE